MPEPEQASATPRDVVHIRLGSFALVALIAFGVLGFVTGLTWLTIVMAVLAVAVAADIVLAVRRQSRTGGDVEAG